MKGKLANGVDITSSTFYKCTATFRTSSPVLHRVPSQFNWTLPYPKCPATFRTHCIWLNIESLRGRTYSKMGDGGRKWKLLLKLDQLQNILQPVIADFIYWLKFGEHCYVDRTEVSFSLCTSKCNTLIVGYYFCWTLQMNCKYKNKILCDIMYNKPVSVAVQSKAWVCGRSPAEIVGSNSAGAWMFVWCECCVLSGRGLCDELITRPGESYRLWCVVVCDLEASRMRRSWPALGRSATRKKKV